ncbi:hypothetical protein BKA62DRAFT_822754 [Auriculariales sp. MPI-PUGE-AT-0066]|nr:hypothetical protein BKA62DRAFT_822754 [Auriculariales sp. MPI-PUGE-AT-0066]
MRVPRTLLLAKREERPATPPDAEGNCINDFNTCDATNCCPANMQCSAVNNEATEYTCLSYSDDPSENWTPPEGPSPRMKWTAHVPMAWTCAQLAVRCCDTECLQYDEQATAYVCKIPGSDNTDNPPDDKNNPPENTDNPPDDTKNPPDDTKNPPDNTNDKPPKDNNPPKGNNGGSTTHTSSQTTTSTGAATTGASSANPSGSAGRVTISGLIAAVYLRCFGRDSA